MISNKTDLIIFMITSLESGIANYFEKFIVIFSYQILNVNQSDKNDIKKISEKIIYNWQ